ncbi:30S ribosomal protein S9 [Estrella lausannensis]|uniref:Small ribosomal subunit protein uS9 n=1 Tax=Estrella lausannensis TaxID=483423 RepID=A0A0H5DP07_9BACT|nr:30S ribosomal protein S9 [Estrella lausannensis]CRX38196.1 30S ribosomal protein S9 [Estrella lausannensis]
MADEYIDTGRRKTAVASVRMRKGTGKVDVNGREFKDYFPLELQRATAMAPLTQNNLEKEFDLVIRVKGGGIEGQATAIRLGIARVLVQLNQDLRHGLKEVGYLTRDSRMKERKKYGQKGARKRFQFSKR